ncbi:MAG: hypothetical protein ACXWT1_19855 [Methylobacter sp.]
MLYKNLPHAKTWIVFSGNTDYDSNIITAGFQLGTILIALNKKPLPPLNVEGNPAAAQRPELIRNSKRGSMERRLCRRKQCSILITDQKSAPLLPLLLERVGVRRFKKPNFEVQTVYLHQQGSTLNDDIAKS